MKAAITKIKNKYYLSQKGFSLVELLIYLSLLGLVLAGIFNIYYFGSRSSMRAQSESEILQDARLVMVYMDQDIRQATSLNRLQNLPEGVDADDLQSTPAVSIESDANSTTLKMYTYVHNEPKRVAYRVIKDNDSDYYIMQRSVEIIHENIHTTNPTSWQIIIENIIIPNNYDVFEIVDNRVLLKYMLEDTRGNLSSPIEFNNTFTVRGKDAM